MDAERKGWFTLGFKAEEVSGAWQHWRLAVQCGHAFEAENLRADGVILETPGRGEYVLFWYLSPEAAALLDRHQVPWRRFLVEEDQPAPVEAHRAVEPLS